jgi:lipopolysaccharide/colanic/teichoic acid biosynthesis glycosyltransferase
MVLAIRPLLREAGARVLAFALLVLSAPLIAVIALAIRMTSGGPAFHRGTRLGRDKRPFQMLKLRTLRVGAELVTRGDLVAQRHGLAIRGGRFLRETRLDELPQLWNIVRGDMSFIGPRPERPEVLRAKCAGIPGYERRFAVRPGLIGISQLFTPHGTAKRYRTLLDNGVIRNRSSAGAHAGIVAFTTWAVVCAVSRRLLRQLETLGACAVRGLHDRRRQARVEPHGATALLGGAGFASTRLLDMNEESLVLECPHDLSVEQALEFLLQIPLPGQSRLARRTARCRGRVTTRRITATGLRLVVRYEACTPRSEYMIHQYFLRDSLAPPHRAWSGSRPAGPRAVPALDRAPAAEPALSAVRARRAQHNG